MTKANHAVTIFHEERKAFVVTAVGNCSQRKHWHHQCWNLQRVLDAAKTSGAGTAQAAPTTWETNQMLAPNDKGST